ncbi:MAG: efflux RND transporter periplasmic adaptor subunit, partial [Bryobacteraceae bacterium]
MSARLFFLLPVLLLAGCAPKADEPPKAVVEVKTAPAQEAELTMMLHAPATVYPREQATIAARITAPIRQILVRKGDTVKAGQTLALLDDRDLAAQRDEAQANVADARATLEKTTSGTLPTDVEHARGQVETAQAAYNQAEEIYKKRKDLYAQGAIPQRDLLISQTDRDTTKTNLDVAQRAYELLLHQSRARDIQIAQSRVEQAQARLRNIEVQLGFTRIVSPFAGSVTDQFQYPGDMAAPSTPMFTVMDMSAAVARAQVPEAIAPRAKIGQPCEFQSSDNPNLRYSGRISVVNRAVDPARRTVETWCEIPRPPSTLRAGMFGDTGIVTGVVKGVVVPQAAVQFNEGANT